MAIECYFISGSPFAWRALLGLSLKRLDYKAIELHGSKGDTQTPEYLAMNPRGKVPVLKDGDVTICESLAILAYLDRKYPDTPLFGANAEEGSLIWQRTLEIEGYLTPAFVGLVRPVLFNQVDGNEETINEGIAKAKEELARYDGWLEGQSFLTGDSVSAADITLYPALAMVSRLAASLNNDKLDLSFLPLAERYTALASWMTRIEALEGFDETYPPHWRTQKAAE